MRTLLALSLVLSTLTPTLALAQDHGDTVTEYTFDDADLVNGTVQSPDGTLIEVGRRRVRQSLIRPRSHYIPEMLRSVETL